MGKTESVVWDHFKIVDTTKQDGSKTQNYICGHCGLRYTYKNATKKLKHLLNQCNGISKEEKSILEESSKLIN